MKTVMFFKNSSLYLIWGTSQYGSDWIDSIMSLWMLQTKNSSLWKVSYAIILLVWWYAY